MPNRIDDPDPAVRQQLAASLGVLPAGPREGAVVALLERQGSDSIVMDAALSGIRGAESAVLEKLTESTAPQAPGRENAITMLAATIVRGAQDGPVQSLFASVAADTRPAWIRSALLRGAEVALLGATPPGSPEVRRGNPATGANLPCPTCPGGRAGPGGAYAFQQTPPAVEGSRGARGSGGAGPGGRGRRVANAASADATVDG